MDNRDKQTFKEKEKTPKSLPSRLEIHGHKYKKTVDEHIEEHVDDDEVISKKKLKISVPLILLVILLLLPASIGIYALKNKDTLKPGQTSGVGEEISIEDYTDDPIPSNQEEEEIKNSPNDKDVEKQPDNEDETVKKEQESEKENVNKENTEKDEPKKPEPEKKEEVKQNEEVEKEPEENTQQNNQTLTHTVKSGETLYRIAMHYYKSQDGIEKIKAANGLTSNEINAGQTLKIPQP